MIYLVGAGYMAHEYARVLKKLEQEFIVIGRSTKSANEMSEVLNIEVVSGGLTKFLSSTEITPTSAIVCTPVESLTSVTEELLDFGLKKILIEKPGAMSTGELLRLETLSNEMNADVRIGYNRRFYQSTLALEKALLNEKLTAANFEITEWAHLIQNEPCADKVKQKWVLANTSHVIDLVMHISGKFEQLSAFSSGKLDWHDASASFVGAGISTKGILLSYCGYWDGPGRWSAEFITTDNRYIFRPMEKLQVQRKGSVAVEFMTGIDYSIDEEFKPGIFLQTVAFLNNDFDKLCSLSEQIEAFTTYEKIANY